MVYIRLAEMIIVFTSQSSMHAPGQTNKQRFAGHGHHHNTSATEIIYAFESKDISHSC
jgi:hypothetical protein